MTEWENRPPHPQNSIVVLDSIIQREKDSPYPSRDIINAATELRNRIRDILVKDNPRVEKYLDRTKHIEGGLTITCVCNFTTHLTPEEIKDFELSMKCPSCNRPFWDGHKRAKEYRRIYER